MYRKKDYDQLEMDLPFGVALNEESKWIRLSKVFPWKRIEEAYAAHFQGNEGQVAKSSRLAFAALYIQTSEGFTDEQTRVHIQENPHMQVFCGYESYQPRPPFDASMMTHFRKRIPAETVMKLTEEVFAQEALPLTDAPTDNLEEESVPAEEEGIGNRGTLILDATCCPADIKYPTDIGLLNHSREITEEIIDILYKPIQKSFPEKPRTYRQKARKEYLAYTKTRKHTASQIRKVLRLQLGYVSRNLKHIQTLLCHGAKLTALNHQLYRKLLVISEVYRQQREMYENRSHMTEARIVSLSQPHIRPIVRGKEGVPVEFGAKVALGLVGGYAFITEISWENIPEASVLPQAAEQYKRMFGFYPKVIIGDRAYPNRGNRTWCKNHGIRLSGPRLGRKSEDMFREEAKQIYQDSCQRSEIEGTFGLTKRKLGLDKIMTKLPDTSQTAIALGFFVANMERKLRLLFAPNSTCFLSFDFDGFLLLVS